MEKLKRNVVLFSIFFVAVVCILMTSKTIFVPEEKAIVSLVFDDGWDSVYDNAFPVMEKYGLRGTAYIVSSYIGIVGSDMMDPDQLINLDKHGWTIASHSVSHPFLTKETTDSIRFELKVSQTNLEKTSSRSVNHFASPYGDCDERVLNLIKRYYSSHRTNQPGINIRPWKVYDLKYMEVNIDTTIEQVRGWIEKAIKSRGWLILGFHKVGEEPKNDKDVWICPKDVFKKICQMVSSDKDLRVATIAEILK